jgi:uncharacterized membrane protein YbjE (DUF340 family)
MIQTLAVFLAGIFFGKFIHFEIPEWFFTILLVALVFTVGISIGNEEKILSKIKKNLNTIIILSVLTITGSLFGGFIASFFTKLDIREAVGASAGLGWYSLSAIMISEVHSHSLGTISFIANIFRELLSIIVVPFLAKITKYGAISCAGATSMDTLLGLISKYVPKQEVLVAFGHGVILSTFVPVLITFIFS